MDAMRIGDADREAAVALLSEQYALGRLSKEEFDERSDAAWSARTNGDLAPLFIDLPVGRAAAAPPPMRRRRRPHLPAPLMAVLVVLVAVTVLTHLPVVLLALVLWCFVARRHWSGHRAGHGTPYPPRVRA